MHRGGSVERPVTEAGARAAATEDASTEQKSERKLERSARGMGQRSHPTLPACAVPSAAARVAELERLEERIAYLKVHEMAARRRGKVKLSNSILIELSGLETRRFKLLKNMERQLRSAAEFQAASELWRRGLLNESREARVRTEEERNIVENARLMVGWARAHTHTRTNTTSLAHIFAQHVRQRREQRTRHAAQLEREFAEDLERRRKEAFLDRLEQKVFALELVTRVREAEIIQEMRTVGQLVPRDLQSSLL
jgi:ATP-dependent protease HslVU (ClpYQ) peptidase subunit